MASHDYIEVPATSKDEEKYKEIFSWKYFLRQTFISSVLWTTFFTGGLMFGTPTVYIPQVRREANSTAAISAEMASWLYSVYGYVSLPWCFILPFLMNRIGRKKTFTIVAFNQVLVATSMYLSKTPMHLLITEILHGMTHASSFSIGVINIVECSAPRNRNILLTIKSASVYWGVWAANAIGTYAPWRYISILSFFNAIYSLTVFFWPESPMWLAAQGRYEECRRSHRWLRGCDGNSEQELEILINSYIEERKVTKKRTVRETLGFFTEKEFYCPAILSVLLLLMYQLSGKQVITLYAIDIIKQITDSESTAYRSMLILDGVSVFAMFAGCFLSKICKRRLMLFTSSSFAVMFLLTMSLYLYLIQLSILTENKYVSVCLLVGFSISIGLGPIILSTTIFGELTHLRYKSHASIIYAVVFMIIQSTLLKNTNHILNYIGMHGMFLFYGICVSICIMILYKYLPETKDKPFYEIEKYFKQQ